MERYLALLRGINVGGNNIIKMVDLKACFEKLGFSDVATYIQSGNVLFSAAEQDEEHITHIIERGLAKEFNKHIPVVVVSHARLKATITGAPRGFGAKPDEYRYDVIFLKKPLTVKEAMQGISIKEGVDQTHAGKGALYFSRLTKKATQSRLSKIVALPMYKNITIRNWNTTTKLLGLMEG
jgi:uncharacterized protein (DUF1697 family)